MRENVEQKGRRYLVEGRLIVERVVERHVRASCRGAGATYTLTRRGSGPIGCTCPALGRCCHRVALELVVALPRGAP